MLTMMSTTILSGRIVIVAAVFSALLFVTTEGSQNRDGLKHLDRSPEDAVDSLSHHRKFLHRSAKKLIDQPDRIWGEGDKCSDSSLLLTQSSSAPLPSGIPTYTVQLMNVCVPGCGIYHIHLHCGWFSSARLIDPTVFKRLSYDDCLVNDGKPLKNGDTITFEYANSFKYPLSIASMICH